jgi:glutamyl-tRNA synthetase
MPFLPGGVDPEKVRRVAPLVRERIKLLKDVQSVGGFFFTDKLASYDTAELIPQKGDRDMALKVLKRAHVTLGKTPFTHDALDAALRADAAELGVKAGQMFQPIRVAVCGQKAAPPLFETLEVIGQAGTLTRIEQAIALIQ